LIHDDFALAVDTGGTFTDFVLLNKSTGETYHHKVPSISSKEAWRSVISGLRDLLEIAKIPPSSIKYFTNGNTIGVNMIIQSKGPSVGLLTTRGFRDILEIGRWDVIDPQNLYTEKIQPLVDIMNVREVNERILSDGSVHKDLSKDEMGSALKYLVSKRKAEAVAICFLFSYLNPRHEKMAKEVCNKLFPQIPVSVSSEIWPEMKEYERACLAIIDVYIKKEVENYLDLLIEESKKMGVRAPIYLITLSGGIEEAGSARSTPISCLTSGTTAGAMGVAFLAKLLGSSQCLGLDMGGTSADISYIVNGELTYSRETSVGGFPISMPAVNVESVGAGGGSIAWLDPQGILKVGPESAGSSPGPAAYNLGNEKPTVTDAFLVCNYLNPDYFLGGRLRLQRDLARQAIGSISEKTGSELERAAEAILRIATSNMTFRIKSMASRLAFNVRECDLIAYGGASPTMLPMILDEMSFRKVILPLSPGTFSAFGGLTADIMKDSVRSVHKLLNQLGVEKIESLFSEMEEELEKWHSAQGLLAAKFRLVKSLELRYVRESFPIDIATTDEQLRDTRILEDLFHAEHEQRYKIFDRNHPILVESLRMRLVGTVSRPPMIDIPARGPAQPISSRNIFVKGEWHEANVYRRNEMSPSDAVTGPAIIEQMDTTTIVPIGMKCTVEKNGLLIISK